MRIKGSVLTFKTKSPCSPQVELSVGPVAVVVLDAGVWIGPPGKNVVPFVTVLLGNCHALEERVGKVPTTPVVTEEV